MALNVQDHASSPRLWLPCLAGMKICAHSFQISNALPLWTSVKRRNSKTNTTLCTRPGRSSLRHLDPLSRCLRIQFNSRILWLTNLRCKILISFDLAFFAHKFYKFPNFNNHTYEFVDYRIFYNPGKSRIQNAKLTIWYITNSFCYTITDVGLKVYISSQFNKVDISAIANLPRRHIYFLSNVLSLLFAGSHIIRPVSR